MADTTTSRSGRNAERQSSALLRQALVASVAWSAYLVAACAAPALGAEPRLLVDGCSLELVASAPDVVTPIGLEFDAQGRLLVVESHTHERQQDYGGPAGDRIRMLADSDGDGQLDKWSTFAEGYRQAMNLCARPAGGIYLVTRRDVRLLEDADGDGRAEKDTAILSLETDVEYPHNGLSGIVFAADACDGEPGLYIGLGENFGGAYQLAGSDGSMYSDHGGAGAVFRCAADGSKLQRYASGFWNPFSLCLHGAALFCVDNDPDSSPPCRLVEVLPAGDYGFRWEYFRPGTHPLQCWNGELPGTLPMICGTGEAPTAVVAHRGYLWVTSWGDHRIERYQLALKSDGQFDAKLTTVVQGDEHFRPTGMAVAPDGSLYFGDWVKRDYAVHGEGRLWRLRVPDEVADAPAGLEMASSRACATHQRRIFNAATRSGNSQPGVTDSAFDRLTRLQIDRWRRTASVSALRRALGDADANVRLYAVRWIAEERLSALRDDVEKLLAGDIPDQRYFLAVLAAIDWLEGDGTMRPAAVSDALLLGELQNPSRSSALHALALRLISPDDGWLTAERMAEYLSSPQRALRQAAVQTLALQSGPERATLLADFAADAKQDAALRADAVAGLAAVATQRQQLLIDLAHDSSPVVAREASRVLRLTALRPVESETPPAPDAPAWSELLAQGGDAESGRRLFFMAAGPRCATCHQHRGRGGRIGPDLTHLGRQQSRERIIASILRPSQEVAPQYQPWTLLTYDGVARLGLRLPEAGDDGEECYADAEGLPFHLSSDEIEFRQPSDKSIMPDGLERTLSPADLRDIVAFLAQQN